MGNIITTFSDDKSVAFSGNPKGSAEKRIAED